MTPWYRVRPFVSFFTVFATSVLLFAASPAAQYAPPPLNQDSPNPDTDWSDAIPAHVAVVDGSAELERDGRRAIAEENVPLLAGDRIQTARGRLEVLFADGSALDLDHFSDVDLLSDALLRLRTGRVRLAIARSASPLAYRVDAAGTTTWIRSAGEYRIVVDERGADAEVRVTVLRGSAELSSPGGRTLIQTGAEARATARTEPSLPYAMAVAAWDTFDQWVEAQHDYRVGARSAQYLPAELRSYGGAFDREGAWEHQQGYGYVWYPRVAADWQPYAYGNWSFVGSFGWTWIGSGRWSWPTHHYGRWGYGTGRWFWVPGRRWAPAWVAWGGAPGYVSWCPLGFDNRPVVSITHINTYYTGRRHGWTVMSDRAFNDRVSVGHHAVAARNTSVTPGTRFASRSAAPGRMGVTASRQSDPLRAPTLGAARYAVPRPDRSTTAPAAVAAAMSNARSRVATPAARVGTTQRSSAVQQPDRPSTFRLARPSAATPQAPSVVDSRRVGSARSRAPEQSAPGGWPSLAPDTQRRAGGSASRLPPSTSSVAPALGVRRSPSARAEAPAPDRGSRTSVEAPPIRAPRASVEAPAPSRAPRAAPSRQAERPTPAPREQSRGRAQSRNGR